MHSNHSYHLSLQNIIISPRQLSGSMRRAGGRECIQRRSVCCYLDVRPQCLLPLMHRVLGYTNTRCYVASDITVLWQNKGLLHFYLLRCTTYKCCTLYCIEENSLIYYIYLSRHVSNYKHVYTADEKNNHRTSSLTDYFLTGGHTHHSYSAATAVFSFACFIKYLYFSVLMGVL